MNEITLRSEFKGAGAEAEKAFKNAGVYIEKLIEKPRHVEVQLLGDHHGNVVHLWERDCTMQRRHQKLIEESPAPNLPQSVREDICKAAVRLAQSAGYNNAGYGKLVVIQHRLGYVTWYAHLSTITTWVGEQVEGGTRIGYVGSTGYSTGPHLHFEVRRYDTPVDPIPMLLSIVSARPASAAQAFHGWCDKAPREGRKVSGAGDWIAREQLCAG